MLGAEDQPMPLTTNDAATATLALALGDDPDHYTEIANVTSADMDAGWDTEIRARMVRMDIELPPNAAPPAVLFTGAVFPVQVTFPSIGVTWRFRAAFAVNSSELCIWDDVSIYFATVTAHLIGAPIIATTAAV
jgi:hypothetical protein